MPFIEQLAQQMGGQAAGSILGLALQGHNDRRQLAQQQKLQDMQISGNKQMLDYQMQKELAMWNATNYKAQRDQLKQAGLNPGLLYGMKGGGGITTGGGAATVAGGMAPQGGHEIISGAGMGMQAGMMAAQMELVKAQTENVKADTVKKSGVDTDLGKTQIASLTQGIENAKAQKSLTEVQTNIAQIEEHIKGKTQNMAIAKIKYEAEQAYEELEILKNEGLISDATYQDKIKIIGAELINIGLRNELLRSQKSLTDKQTTIADKDITLKGLDIEYYWDKIATAIRNADAATMQAETNQFVNDVANSTKLAVDVVEKIVQGVILRRIFSGPQTNPIKGFHQR